MKHLCKNCSYCIRISKDWGYETSCLVNFPNSVFGRVTQCNHYEEKHTKNKKENENEH